MLDKEVRRARLMEDGRKRECEIMRGEGEMEMAFCSRVEVPAAFLLWSSDGARIILRWYDVH